MRQAEVGRLQLQGDAARGEVRLAQALRHLLGQLQEDGEEVERSLRSSLNVVSAEMLLVSRSATHAAGVAPLREAGEAQPFLAVAAGEFGLAAALEVRDGAQSVAGEPFLRHLADAGEDADRLAGQEGDGLRPADHREARGLSRSDAILARNLL